MKHTNDITICAFFTVLFIIGSRITIPTGLIPLTLQTMVVFLAGMILNPRQIAVSYTLYFLMGLLGLPVFANGGGFVYVLQPSFGFLLAFPIAACFISLMRRKLHTTTLFTILPFCFIALCIIYAIGCAYMYGILNWYMGSPKNLTTIISIGVLPFLLSDSISIVLATICGLRLVRIPVIKRTIHL